MTYETIQDWINNNPIIVLPMVLIIAFLLYRGTRFLLARGAFFIALQTETVYIDLIVDHLQPFRFAWLAPLLLIYNFAIYFSLEYSFVEIISLILIIWFSAEFLIAILSGVNEVYKHNPRYQGVSVAGYIGILKVSVVVGAIVLTISYLFEVEPIALLGGLGAWLAVLLLIFRDTILSFLASIQISTQQLIKEGDEVSIPAFGASGLVTDIDLQTITIRNYSNTITTIPTSKITEVGFENMRPILESGNRRIKHSILLDADTIRFVDKDFVERLSRIDFIQEHLNVSDKQELVLTTNLDLFIQYASGYLKNKKEIRSKNFPFMIRVLETTIEGTPLEFYMYVKAKGIVIYEQFRTKIFIHLLAVMPYFELKVFQQEYRE
ncbi:MAG: mechanosensitive ion channel [Anaerolineales bacterium]|nr:MAG: mechanosensitive ion channel [Anaerolineales bacterium]